MAIILHFTKSRFKIDLLLTKKISTIANYADTLKVLFHENCVTEAFDDIGTDIRQSQDKKTAKINGSGTIIAFGLSGVLIQPARAFGTDLPDFFCCQPHSKPLPLAAQLERMRIHFPDFKTRRLPTNIPHIPTVQWTGPLTPWEGGATYTVQITYQRGYHPNVKVLSHDVGDNCIHIYRKRSSNLSITHNLILQDIKLSV